MTSEISRKSILVIDEDSDVLVFLTQLFESRGVRVLRARSRAEGMEILSRPFVPVDLVLVNLMIRDAAGLVNARRPGVSVLYMSARVDLEVIRIEVMQRHLSGSSGADKRGVLDAVLSELTRPQARATGV